MPKTPENKPFPGMHVASAPPDNPNGYRTFTLPVDQAKFDDWAMDLDLYRRHGKRRWQNIDGRNVVKLQFQLDIPRHLRGGSLHTVTDRGKPTERSVDLWPNAERAVRVVVAAGAECTLPAMWDTAILKVHEGRIVGGAAPGTMRPIGAGTFDIDAGLSHLTPDQGPEAA